MSAARITPASATLDETLANLLGDWAPPPHAPALEPVLPHQLPTDARKLLVHRAHMTRVLQDHYGEAVSLQVQRAQLTGDAYRRQITLSLPSTSAIVELGLVRIHLQFVPPAVKREILDQQTPLGAILIAHDVLRIIEPRWFFTTDADSPLVRSFHLDLPGGPLFGRLGTIYCNGAPAIDVLEIITGTGGTRHDYV